MLKKENPFKIPKKDYNNTPYVFNRDNMVDVIGRYRTLSLFYEYNRKNEEFVSPFTLKSEDTFFEDILRLSLKKIYMSYNHVPSLEYQFAMDVFGSWEHWTILSTESGVREYIKVWQDEMEVKLKAKALQNLMLTSLGESSSATTANKYIADRGWEVKAGRPSKEEKLRLLKQETKVRETLNEDMNRLGLNVIQGDKRG